MAELLAKMGLEAARQLSQSKTSGTMFDRLVAMGMENIVLSEIDQNTLLADGKTAAERRADLKLERAEYRKMAAEFPIVYGSLSETDRLIYLDRVWLHGEANAMRWVIKTFGTNSP